MTPDDTQRPHPATRVVADAAGLTLTLAVHRLDRMIGSLLAVTKQVLKHAVKEGCLAPLRTPRIATGALRRLPDYLIVGGQKCGTTSLAAYLNAHAHVVHLPWVKEVHFFDRSWHRGVRYYRSWFPLRATRPSALAGEATPYYLFHPLAAERAALTVPAARIIAVLRNPIDRAFSHYKHNVRYGREPLSFSEAVDREEERLAGESAALRAGARVSWRHQHYSYIARGSYACQLREWLRVFPREQVLVLGSEGFFGEPDAHYQRVTHFLGLPQSTLSRYARYNVGGSDSLCDATRERLAALFATANEELYELVGTNFGWRA
jgi:hypothetical protein